MSGFVSARESCLHKEDFDYCMKNWRSLPNETATAWSPFERQPFRDKLMGGMKGIVEDVANPIPSEVPPSILAIMKDELFHSITMLDTINKSDQALLDWKDRAYELAQLLAEYWLKSSYLTQILLSFVKEPNSTRKMANTKNYFGVIFTAGEKFIERKKFLQILLGKVDAALRVMVERDDARILKECFPTSIATIIDRTFIRFCSGTYRNFLGGEDYMTDNPFLVFMESLIDLTRRGYRIQRMISNILHQITPPAQEKLLSSWFAVATDIKNVSTVPFYPLTEYLSCTSYKKTLLHVIPFEPVPHFSPKFWTNWASYLTSVRDMIPMVWETFMEAFWELTSVVLNGEKLKNPAYAFAALATAIKPEIASLPLKRLIHVSNALDKLTRLMEAVDLNTMHTAWGIAHILFDLDRIQHEVKTGNSVSSEPVFDCDGEIFLQLVGFYEGKSPEEILSAQPADNVGQVEYPLSVDEENRQEKFDEGLDDRVRRLQSAGVTPTSMSDVYHILVGETAGSNDLETEALKQVAILSIPVLLSGGESVDNVHLESITKILFEWGEDKELDDFVTVALFELGIAYPDSFSKTLGNIVFSNIGVADKSHMLQVTEKILIYCGTNRCISCFSMYGPYKKDEMNKFIRRMLPAFFPQYLHRNRDQPLCITCPPTRDEEPYESEESITLRLSSQIRKEPPLLPQLPANESAAGPDNQATETALTSSCRGPPPTRRWGTKRKQNMQVVTSKKKTLHTSIWASFCRHLAVESNLFLNKKSLVDGIQVHMLTQLLDFLKILVMTYTGLSCFVQNIPKEALNLIQIYGSHPNSKVRKGLWGLLVELIKNTNISGDLCLLEGSGEVEYRHDLFSYHLEKENDPEIREFIIHIRKVYNFQKFKA